MTGTGGYDPTGVQTGGGYTEPSYTTPASTYSTAPAYEPPAPPSPGTMTFILAVVGVVIILVGAILQATVIKIDDPDDGLTIWMVASIMVSIGVTILAIGLFFGAIKDVGLGDYIRVGLGIAAGIIVGLWASGGNSIFNLLAWM